MNFAVLNNHKLIIGLTAKSGCTYIKNLCVRASTGERPPVGADIHNNPRWKSLELGEEDVLLSRVNKWDNLTLREYKVVFIMRNPYERLVSGFLDKYQPPGFFKPNGGDFYRHLPKSYPLTFEKFTDSLLGHHRWKYIDRTHFKPQVRLPNQLCSIQNLVSEFKIWDLKNIDYDYLNKSCSINNSSTISRGPHQRKATTKWEGPENISKLPMTEYIEYNVSYSSFYTPELKSKINKFFQNDFRFAQTQNIHYDV